MIGDRGKCSFCREIRPILRAHGCRAAICYRCLRECRRILDEEAPRVSLRHVGCGGEVFEDADSPIRYDDGETKHAPLFCEKCNAEILGDAEMEEEQ